MLGQRAEAERGAGDRQESASGPPPPPEPRRRSLWKRHRPAKSLFVSARENPERFAEVFVAYREPMLRFFVREVLDPETAWDLTAETFAEGFAAIDRFRGTSDEEGRAWLWAIAKNDLYTWRRKRTVERRRLAQLGFALPSPSDVELEYIEDLLDVQSLRPSIEAALSSLGRDQREAVLLRVVEQLEYDEVARRLGVTRDVARARVSRGLRKLALYLNDVAAYPAGS